jgi:hypothetical protein
MRDTNPDTITYTDTTDNPDAHAYGKSDCYANGNTYNYTHTYSNSHRYSQSNTAPSSDAAASPESTGVTDVRSRPSHWPWLPGNALRTTRSLYARLLRVEDDGRREFAEGAN